MRSQKRMRHRQFHRAPVIGGHWRLRQLRQFDFGFQYEEDDKLVVVIPLPGVKKDGLQVKAKEQLLSITASIQDELRDYAVRPDDSWDIVLKEKVIPESANARYIDGVLLIDLDMKQPPTEVGDIQYE